MAQQLSEILEAWLPSYQQDWVAAVITHVSGSSYRKPGAIMLFDSLGKSLGMLSGGCLEADLRRHAQRVMQTGQTLTLTYDASDESDQSYQLGCGGIVTIMLVSLTKANDYLGLLKLYDALNHGQSCRYQLSIPSQPIACDELSAQVEVLHSNTQALPFTEKTQLLNLETGENTPEHILSVPVRAPIHLGIFGGGLDAKPVCEMAQLLGWRVSVFDSRSAYARNYDFAGAKIYKHKANELPSDVLSSLNCAFVLHHNLELDADALRVLAQYPLQYVALLGPGHRRDKVLTKAELTVDDFSGVFSAPAGLALGGELPSSIALSMLSQCHSVLYQSKMTTLDKVMS
ncbi:XdhC/CoxI family protein [Shewanella sp. WXL01]|uniref:XdhC family protein n=1 Tax=Shewanella sp. WXL01 TaxID=2709721 RepID=UPI001438508C|nr:XdhC/CoxI family protein [Shewanella sp. WXL01]NKF50282.1 XdhC/CoxI family protein [Shewanella sp. WXL01]